MFQIKGRMGLSLNVQQEGTHIAFAAGTGILPFIDIIGHLILSLASEGSASLNSDSNILQNSENKVNPERFKLVLYTSFLDEDEAIGLKLI